MAKLFTKKDLREKGYTIAQISVLPIDGVVKTGKKGRPSFGYLASTVKDIAGKPGKGRSGTETEVQLCNQP